MPLSSGLPNLKSGIEAAYIKAKNSGKEDGADPFAIIAELSNDIGNSIHEYMETALVTTTIVIEPASSNASGSPAATAVPIASYVTPGVGTGTGTISFEGGDVSTLISEIEAAFIKVKTSGKENAANPDVIIKELALDLKTAIDKFALTALVETDVIASPGQTVVGYMAIAGPSTIPVPATSLAGTGSGVGDPGVGEGLS